GEPRGERGEHLVLDRGDVAHQRPEARGGEDEDPRRPARLHRRGPRLSGEKGDLADEVARPELVDDAYPAEHVRFSLDEDDELEAAGSLARQVPGVREVELVRERGDLGELALRAALEQRNPLQQLDLRVLAQHRPRYSLLHGPI